MDEIDKFHSVKPSPESKDLDNIISPSTSTVLQDPNFTSERIFIEKSKRYGELGVIGRPHEASGLSQIPRFFEALFVLIICGLLLAVSLLIIRKTKEWCTHRPQNDNVFEKDDEENGSITRSKCKSQPSTLKDSENFDTPSIIKFSNENDKQNHSCDMESKPEKDESTNSPLTDLKSSPPPHQSTSTNGSSLKTVRPSQRVKGDHVTFVRRSSDHPFGDDALAYAEATYHKVKDTSKEPKDDKFTSWARKFSTRRHPSSSTSDIEMS